MTIDYVQDLATARVGNILKLHIRWRGGLWKTVYFDLICWAIGYVVVALIYRHVLSASQQESFEKCIGFCDVYEKYMPLVFMLGFFVETVVNRWWKVVENMGITDDMALTVSCYLRGTDDRTLKYKRTIVRYMCLFQVLIYRVVSSAVRKRYPNLDSLIEHGYLLSNERKELLDDEIWIPIHWSMALAIKAREEGLIRSDHFLKHIIETCEKLGTTMRIVWIYSFINVPIAYSQVIFFVVRLYFAIALVGQQVLLSNEERLDIYVPISTIFAFIFYFGWLKVAEALLNPFGSDDDDFEAITLLERNKAVCS